MSDARQLCSCCRLNPCDPGSVMAFCRVCRLDYEAACAQSTAARRGDDLTIYPAVDRAALRIILSKWLNDWPPPAREIRDVLRGLDANASLDDIARVVVQR